MAERERERERKPLANYIVVYEEKVFCVFFLSKGIFLFFIFIPLLLLLLFIYFFFFYFTTAGLLCRVAAVKRFSFLHLSSDYVFIFLFPLVRSLRLFSLL